MRHKDEIPYKDGHLDGVDMKPKKSPSDSGPVLRKNEVFWFMLTTYFKIATISIFLE